MPLRTAHRHRLKTISKTGRQGAQRAGDRRSENRRSRRMPTKEELVALVTAKGDEGTSSLAAPVP